MEDSILRSTKKILSIAPDYDAFDLDIITHINAALAIAHDLGVGPDGGFFIDGPDQNWADLNLTNEVKAMLRSYVFLKVKMVFDPTASRFVIDAHNKQIAEFESRMNGIREVTLHPYVEPVVVPRSEW